MWLGPLKKCFSRQKYAWTKSIWKTCPDIQTTRRAPTPLPPNCLKNVKFHREDTLECKVQVLVDQKLELVSLCFEPSQPQRITSGLCWSEQSVQYHLPETNCTGSVSDIVADDICCQPIFRLPRDLVDINTKLVEIKAATVFSRLVCTWYQCVFYFLVLYSFTFE